MRLLGTRRKCVVAALAAAATLAIAPLAEAYHEGDERIVDETAHVLRAREARLGIWQLQFAPVSFATVGTDTAAWAASFLLQAAVKNGHVKLQLLRTRPLTISVAAAVYHANLRESGPLVAGNGSLLLVPASVFVSSDLSRTVSLHLGVTYAHVDFDGDVSAELGSSAARAALAASALQVHAMGEVRVSRVVALTLQVHGQPYASPPALRVSTTTASGEKVDFAGTVTPIDQTALAAVASVVISGRHFNVRFGGGYGAIFLPAMGLTIPVATVVPELDAYVRF